MAATFDQTTGAIRSAEEWHQLKSEIEQIIPLQATPIQLGGRDFTWYRVADPECLLTAAVDNAAQPAEELDPFWAATWRAALGLDAFLGTLDLAGQRVLELGCGSGQAGVGAALRGAMVTLTDAVALAMMVARLNAWPAGQQVQFRRLKWTQEQLPEPAFPVIIGSDLVYDPNLFPLLEACAREHLAEDGRLYLSEPHRHSGDRFARWIVAAGWKMREHDVDLQDARVPIRVFECWL